MFQAIEFQSEEKYINDFLRLPKLLYDKSTYTQNETQERQILEETHVLCKYCKQRKLLVYSDTGEVCGRCIVTLYEDSDTAYIGYFECIEDDECAKVLFDQAHVCAKEAGYTKMVGPVDTSFWIKYRLKADHFDQKPYTGEPYNMPYYKQMFENNGYRVLERWVSNLYKKIPLFYKRKNVYKERLENARRANYRIVSPKKKDFDATIDIIYELISETFRDFVTFRKIAIEDFREVFKNYRYIVDYRFLKIVYCEKEPVAFSLVLPDYRNYPFGELTAYKKIRILLKRIRSSNYISLYMGVLKEHRGLGKALTQKIIKNLYIRRSACIGALITEGKITEKYGEENITDKIRYYLFEKEL
ncbi:MAG: hypothetical protein LBM60_06825 [Clostridium sp.]|jgi:hypothetical protein|nr:hypothetical protein [Clostridium sp.]